MTRTPITNANNITIASVTNAMKRVVEHHLIDQKDREALLALSEISWVQLAVAAMVASAKRPNN